MSQPPQTTCERLHEKLFNILYLCSCGVQKLSPCFLCGTPGHLVSQCPNRHCNNCGLPGHLYDACSERPYWHKQCHRCDMAGHFFDVSQAEAPLVCVSPESVVPAHQPLECVALLAYSYLLIGAGFFFLSRICMCLFGFFAFTHVLHFALCRLFKGGFHPFSALKLITTYYNLKTQLISRQ